MQVRFLALFLPGFISLFAQTAAPPERGAIEGSVTNGITGEPIAGARVRLQAGGDQDPLFTTTDDTGYYRFSGLDLTSYQLDVMKPGFVKPNEGPNSWGLLASVSLSNSRRKAEQELKLYPQAAVAGKVLDASGTPLPGAEVLLVRDMPVRPGQRAPANLPRTTHVGRVVTNDLGEYRFAPLSEGAYYVQVTPGFELRLDKSLQPTYYPQAPDLASAKQIEVRYAQEIRLDIRMIQSRGVRVAGRLINAPEQSPGARPEFYTRLALARPEPEPANYSGPFATTMGEQFELTNVLPGRYELEAVAHAVPENPLGGRMPKTLLWARMPVVVGESGIEDLQVVLQPPVELSGSLKFKDGCRAVSARIRLWGPRSRLVSSPEAASNDDGAFVLNVIPGTYDLEINRAPGLPWAVSARLDGKEGLSGLEVTSATKGPLEVTMTCAEAEVRR